MVFKQNNQLIIKYPVEGTILFSDTLTIHHDLLNKADPYISGIHYEIDGIASPVTNDSGTHTITGLTEGKHRLSGYLLDKRGKKIQNTEISVTFNTYDSRLTVENKLSTVLESTIPEFVREDYPNFIMFIRAYYEWMYSSNNPFYAPLISEDFKDIDKTPDYFVQYFRKQYLKNFPESLTKDRKTGGKLNEKTLIKNIVDFYQSKGTEKSIKFLLKILYDTYSEIYLPKRDIIKSSDSKWTKRKSIKFVYSSSTEAIHQIKNNRFYQTSGTTLISRATIDDIQVYSTDNKKIVEVFFSNEIGTFDFDKQFQVDLADEIVYLTPIPIISGLTITDGGLNYKVNDKITIFRHDVSLSDIREIGYAKVSEVSKEGIILKTEMIYFGETYHLYEFNSYGILEKSDSGLIYHMEIQDGDTEIGTDAEFEEVIGYIADYSGFWSNKNSHTDTIKKMQDNLRYQDFSYVVRVDRMLDRYLDVLKKLAHPAGISVLGDVLIHNVLVEPAIIEDAFVVNFMPLIGNYCAFRPETNVNIRDEDEDLFPAGFDPTQFIPDQDGTGDSPHEASTNRLDDYVDGMKFGFVPDVPDSDNVNLYWVVYPHPNTEINSYTSADTFFDITISDFVKQEKTVI